MASLDSLPADQRAVLQLVLQRARSYDQIAGLLSIDRNAVRERALRAVEALGPQTGVSEDRRGVIADYLLGQLEPGTASQARNAIAASPSERAWARVVASELAPLTTEPLPTITSAPSSIPDASPPPQPASPASPEPTQQTSPEPTVPVADSPERRSSKLGGIALIALTVVIVAVVAIKLLSSGSSNHPRTVPSASATTSAVPAAAGSTTAAAGSTTASGSATTPAKVVAQINLTPPQGKTKTAGIAEVLKEGANHGIAIVAQNVTPNTTRPPTAYAVWLYNSANDSHLLGFVNPGVGSNGRLSTAGGLPANASHFKQLIVTRETKASPKTPGTIILHGTLTGL